MYGNETDVEMKMARCEEVENQGRGGGGWPDNHGTGKASLKWRPVVIGAVLLNIRQQRLHNFQPKETERKRFGLFCFVHYAGLARLGWAGLTGSNNKNNKTKQL